MCASYVTTGAEIYRKTVKNNYLEPVLLQRSTIQLLRFPFSFFLLPVYLFALSRLLHPNWLHALLIFFILHVLVYPASNGYNSYMDRDEESIGGVKKPLQPTPELFAVTVAFDATAVILSFLISIPFALGIVLYILASRAYSYRGIRLKRYPLTGYLIVIIFQGAVTFWLVYHGCHPALTLHVPAAGMLAGSLLIGGFYPLTQIYQFEADKRDGVRTISMVLGYRNTFLFTGIVYFFAFAVLACYFITDLEVKQLMILQVIMLPVLVYFFVWARKVWRNHSAADFAHTMKMNVLASCCSSAAFLTLIILRFFE